MLTYNGIEPKYGQVLCESPLKHHKRFNEGLTGKQEVN